MQKSNVTTVRATGRHRAVVFVHGYSGERDDTWDRFPALLGTASADWDIFTVGYATNTFLPDIAGIWSADPELPKLATLLRTNLDMPPFDGYRFLALIAHSMGGLIVQKALVDDPEIAKRLKHVILFGTPSAGLAKAGWVPFWKRQLSNMARGSAFIKTLREDWTRLYANPSFNFVAVAGASDEFVPSESSLDPFEKRFQKVVEGNHVSIVKPDGANSASVSLVTAILASGKAPSPDVAEELRRASEQPNPKAPALVNQLEAGQATLTLQELVNAALALDHLGQRAEAIALLERHRENDTDVKGTLAGRYKRLWLEAGDVGHAERALELYSQALKAAEKPDQIYYLAINVAFMNFVYRDDVNAARAMANLALKHAQPAGDDMWKTATIGEAYLYLGRPYDALAEYKHLKTLKAPDWKHRSAAQQATRIAAKLGDRKFAEELDAIFSPKAAEAKTPAAKKLVAKKTPAKRPRSRNVDFAILTPTAVEFDMMCEELTGPENGQDVNWPTKVGMIGEHRVAVFLSGKGQEPTATTVTLVAQRYKPRWLLLVGIAGGTRKLHRGDLIVANFVYSVDYGKLIAGHFLRRPELDWMADPALSARGAVLAEGVSRPWIADVRLPRPDGKQAAESASVVGYVGSSDKVVDDLTYPMIADALKTATEIDAFEMEAAGAGISVAYARATHNVGLLMIRGISDEPHGGKEDKDEPPAAAGSEQRAKWKRYASHVAAVFSRHLIASMPIKPSARRRKAKAAQRAE